MTTTRLLLSTLLAASGLARADTVGCLTTAWKLIGANHKVCVDAFHDPKVPGVTCHVSQARTGGVSGSLGLAVWQPLNAKAQRRAMAFMARPLERLVGQQP